MCRHFGKWPPPCTPTRSIVPRQNSESTELHSLTILQACSQAVDLKVDRHFGEGQADSGGVLFHDPAEHSYLCVRVVRRRTDEFTRYAERAGRVQKPRLCFLPVRQVNIRGHEHVAFVFLVVGFRTKRNQRRPSENRNSYQRGPMTSHWNSPFALGLACWSVCSHLRSIRAPARAWLGKFRTNGRAPSLPRPLRFRLPLVRNFRFQLYLYAKP